MIWHWQQIVIALYIAFNFGCGVYRSSSGAKGGDAFMGIFVGIIYEGAIVLVLNAAGFWSMP